MAACSATASAASGSATTMRSPSTKLTVAVNPKYFSLPCGSAPVCLEPLVPSPSAVARKNTTGLPNSKLCSISVSAVRYTSMQNWLSEL